MKNKSVIKKEIYYACAWSICADCGSILNNVKVESCPECKSRNIEYYEDGQP